MHDMVLFQLLGEHKGSDAALLAELQVPEKFPLLLCGMKFSPPLWNTSVSYDADWFNFSS